MDENVSHPSSPMPNMSTAQRILAEAERLFATHGYAGVTLRMVSEAAKVPLGGIAYHFGSKEGLYRAIWAHRMAHVDNAALFEAAQIDKAESPEEAVRRIIGAFFAGPRMVLRQAGGHRFIAIIVREANDPTASQRGLLEAYLYPNGNRVRVELAAQYPALSAASFAIGFQMTMAALGAVIEHERAPRATDAAETAHFDQLFAAATNFVAHGWAGLSE